MPEKIFIIISKKYIVFQYLFIVLHKQILFIMIEWWTSLSTMMKVLWAITLSASLVFVIQTILTFIGADSDFNADFDAGFDADAGGADAGSSGMGLLTFRNFVNFLLGFGWSSVLLRSEIGSTSTLFIVSIIIGIGLVAIVMLLFKWISGMQESGNIDVFKSAVNCTGKVYLTIPEARKGEGKVQITINNAVREYNAVTDGNSLPTGKDIRVVEVINQSTLLVEEEQTIII